MTDDGRTTVAPSDARPIDDGRLAAKLVVVAGPDEGRELAIDGEVELGSDEGCALVLRDPAVSRRHIVVSARGGRVRVRDLGSRNGTFLGGARIVDAELPYGAVVSLGNSAVVIQPRWYVRELPPSSETRFGELVGTSLPMRELFAVLERVSPTDVTVLIEGESGTGKELTARSIHQRSSRADKPYVVFDCGAIPGELAESELFGHKRGAFSGAVADREGAFTRADGGTICLDEIGELPLELQPKLLRVLESGEVRAVGDDVVRKIDVRVIAATNRDLTAEARRGRFRSDLLYRLEVVRVRLPPLRLRPDDVPQLVAHLLAGKLSDGALAGGNLARLSGYSWPGNVREMRNVLTRAVALATKPGAGPPKFDDLVINLGPASESPASIGPAFPGVDSPMPFKDAKAQLLVEFERAYVERLLARHQGNVTRAADAAGLSRKHLYELIRRATGEETGDGEPDLK
jgi:transcriptional regulator with GAF, ATPase, and Fis domain